MTNTKISNNNPEDESVLGKSVSKGKGTEISQQKLTQNKKVTSRTYY